MQRTLFTSERPQAVTVSAHAQCMNFGPTFCSSWHALACAVVSASELTREPAWWPSVQEGRGAAIWEVLGAPAVVEKRPVTNVQKVVRRPVGRGVVELAAADMEPTA